VKVFQQEIEKLPLRRDTAGVDLIVFDSVDKLARKAPFLGAEIKWKAAEMKAVVDRIAIHRLSPGAAVEPHTDELDGDFTRLHLPITAPVYWWDEEGGDRILEQGVWSDPVPYNKLHSVQNPTEQDRLTVIVDFDEDAEYASWL
jgi:hypothetical protein